MRDEAISDLQGGIMCNCAFISLLICLVPTLYDPRYLLPSRGNFLWGSNEPTFRYMRFKVVERRLIASNFTCNDMCASTSNPQTQARTRVLRADQARDVETLRVILENPHDPYREAQLAQTGYYPIQTPWSRRFRPRHP